MDVRAGCASERLLAVGPRGPAALGDRAEGLRFAAPRLLQKWYHETMGELRKVSWPSLKDAWRLTRIVLIVLVAMGALLGLLDYIFSQLVTLLLA